MYNIQYPGTHYPGTHYGKFDWQNSLLKSLNLYLILSHNFEFSFNKKQK